MGCDDSGTSTTEKAEAKIVQFTLQCGGTNYRGNINENDKIIRISGITSRAAITGVRYQLSGEATISPAPQETERWEREQRFTVTSSDNQTAKYIVLLPELQDEIEPEPVSNKVVIGYLPASDWEYNTQSARY